MPGSKEEAEANRRKLSKGERGDKGAGRDARFRNDGAPKNKAKKGEKNKNNRKQGQRGGGAPPAGAKKPEGGKRKSDAANAEAAREAREAKKKKRAEAFGTAEQMKSMDPEWEAKLAARAARFSAQ